MVEGSFEPAMVQRVIAATLPAALRAANTRMRYSSTPDPKLSAFSDRVTRTGMLRDARILSRTAALMEPLMMGSCLGPLQVLLFKEVPERGKQV